MLKIPVDQYLKDLATYTWTFNHHKESQANTNPTLVKADPALLFGICITNNSGQTVYIKLYNTSVLPQAGAVPVALTYNAVALALAPCQPLRFDSPLLFDKGLAYTLTNNPADTDTAAISTGVSIDVQYR